MKPVVVLKTSAQLTLNQGGACDRSSEPCRIPAERALEFSEDFGGASVRFDALELRIELGAGNFGGVDFAECRFALSVAFNGTPDHLSWQHLFEGRFLAGAVLVIDALDRRTVSTQGGQLIGAARIQGNQNGDGDGGGDTIQFHGRMLGVAGVTVAISAQTQGFM
jgi:hypothetical protein